MTRPSTGLLSLLLLCIGPSNAFAPHKYVRSPPLSSPSRVHPAAVASHRRESGVVMKAAAPKGGAKLALAGKIAPFLSKLVIDQTKARKIGSALKAALHPVDLLVIACVGWFSGPLVRFVYEEFIKKWRKKEFDQTHLFSWQKLASQVAKIAALVYAVDLFDVILTAMGYEVAKKHDFGGITANIAYPLWMGWIASKWKKKFLRKLLKKQKGGNKQGKLFLFNRILDVLIAITTLLTIADKLSIQTGKALSSVFALGSVGSLVLGLASKGIAEQFVSGLALSTTDKFYEGDEILFGDGTAGIVVNIGWMTTDIRKFDEVIVKIPNSQIASQRVSNISRMRLCAVQQTLRFKYEDIDKIPQVLADIKDEVKNACPKLITDGSRPFRAHWRDFEGDHIEVKVDFRFRIPPTGDVYFDNREKCLLAIGKAAKMNNVEFAIPAVVSYNKIDNIAGIDAGDVRGVIGSPLLPGPTV